VRSDSAADAGLLRAVQRIADEAAALILQIYARPFEVQQKDDASPVTLADRIAEDHIVSALRRLTPDIPIVAEEAMAAGDPVRVGDRFWLVDPLDGTREFVSRNGEFTVNVALIEDGLPILGVVQVPVKGQSYVGWAGQGAWLTVAGQSQALAGRSLPAGQRAGEGGADKVGLVLACSRSHNDEAAMAQWLQSWMAGHCPGQVLAGRIAVGSSLKFGLIAEGRADIYPRLSRTMEWDTAAGHAVLRAAGGEVMDLQGQVLRYGKPGFENPHFVALGQPQAMG